MLRWTFFAYGVFTRRLSLAMFAAMAGFVGNCLALKSIDSAPGDGFGDAVIDLLLIGLFGLQHSVMARPWFKRVWTRLIPQPIERSTYCLFSSVVMILLMWQWRGLHGGVLGIPPPGGGSRVWGVFSPRSLVVPLGRPLVHHFRPFPA